MRFVVDGAEGELNYSVTETKKTGIPLHIKAFVHARPATGTLGRAQRVSRVLEKVVVPILQHMMLGLAETRDRDMLWYGSARHVFHQPVSEAHRYRLEVAQTGDHSMWRT